MAINETLKFSWGHIIAFVALIFISYVSFMGIAYLKDGDFIWAGVGVLIIDLLLIVFFIVPQILKGTENEFKNKIIAERTLFFLAPFAFMVALIPYSHFWAVFENRENIETIFTESVETTKEMFEAYEKYADNRITSYDKALARKKTKAVERENKVEALKLQLKDKNYYSLKESAFNWIDNASGATVWNVFMIGNIDEIENALNGWNSSLTDFSNKIMSDEGSSAIAFSPQDESVTLAKENLNSLREVYTSEWKEIVTSKPTILAISIGLFLYLLLLFPYIIQSRNTKGTYRLIGSESTSSKPRSRENKRVKNQRSQSEDYPINMDDESTSSNSGDYDSFTM